MVGRVGEFAFRRPGLAALAQALTLAVVRRIVAIRPEVFEEARRRALAPLHRVRRRHRRRRRRHGFLALRLFRVVRVQHRVPVRREKKKNKIKNKPNSV